MKALALILSTLIFAVPAGAAAGDALEGIIAEATAETLRIERGMKRWAVLDLATVGTLQCPSEPNLDVQISALLDDRRILDQLANDDWLAGLERSYALRSLSRQGNAPSGATEYDIPLSDHQLVDVYVEYFTGRGRKFFRKWLARAERYRPMMQPILEKHGLPLDIFYLAMIESGLSSRAYSSAAASGFWQFIRSTGKMFGLRQDSWVDERRDFVMATEAAARYLTQLHRQFGDWHLAWASYNAGSGRISRAMKRTGAKSYWELVDREAIPKETRHYVPKIIAAAIVAKNARAFGFHNITGQEPLEYEEIAINTAIDMGKLASALGVDRIHLRDLNPIFLHDVTPPRRKITLRVPVGRSEEAAAWIATQDPLDLVDLAHYEVRTGDTLSRISRHYGVSMALIKDFNKLRSVHTLFPGQSLLIPTSKKPKARGKRTRRVVAAAKERKHVVSAGDTLWSISRRYRCTVENLREWNSLGGNSIRLGQILKLR